MSKRKFSLVAAALLVSAMGVHAEEAATPQAMPAGGVPAAKAVLLPDAAAAPSAKAATPESAVSVRGATTKVGSPLTLQKGSGAEKEPEFWDLYKVAAENPVWTVTELKAGPAATRLTAKNVKGDMVLRVDTSPQLLTQFKVKTASTIDLEVQSSGKMGLVKIVANKTPIGFIASPGAKIGMDQAN